MGYWSDKLIEQEILHRGYDGPTSNRDNGKCEICGCEYYYHSYKDDTPGFRESGEVVQPCECGKYYGWVKNNERYRYYKESNRYVR